MASLSCLIVIIRSNSTQTHSKVRKVLPNIPVHSVIYTHGHYDHVFGVTPFDEEADRYRPTANEYYASPMPT